MPERESFTSLESGHEYSFIYLPATSPSNPTLLFLHGFPSQLNDWAFQIAYFSSHGYGVVAPDLLGYGQSSKPDDAAQYRLKLISDDIYRLLDHLDLPSVVGVGHDFGATLLSRMVAYESTRWSALVFLAVGPPRMGNPFDLDMINSMTKDFLGYEFLGYITWLGGDEAEEAQTALESHPEAAMSLVFPADQSVWRSGTVHWER
uniref:AB hydrolase-1 domain-containing protein n=1 Tax=Bionectria ochroleuca TaxID=29856 RepID=A0A8H7K7Q2_BIOOC